MIDFSYQLFRSSSTGIIMTPGKKKDEVFGQTAKSKCQEIFLEVNTGRTREYSSKQIEKGLRAELDAIRLLSRFKGKVFKKNTERLYNDYQTGEPDIIDVNEGYDTKCSWDIWTFPFFDTELDKKYEWQNQSYMWLTGLPKWTTAYCLINASSDEINTEKKFMWYKLGMPDDTDETYVKKCIEIEKNMIFDMPTFIKHNPGYDLFCKEWTFDLSLKRRIKEFVTYRDDEKIEAIKNQIVNHCRPYLNSLR